MGNSIPGRRRGMCRPGLQTQHVCLRTLRGVQLGWRLPGAVSEETGGRAVAGQGGLWTQ